VLFRMMLVYMLAILFYLHPGSGGDTHGGGPHGGGPHGGGPHGGGPHGEGPNKGGSYKGGPHGGGPHGGGPPGYNKGGPHKGGPYGGGPPGYNKEGPGQRHGKVDPKSCAVVIPNKKGKGLCIKYSMVDQYLERAILNNDLGAKFKLEIESSESQSTNGYLSPSKEYLHELGEVLLDATEGLADRYDLDKKALNVYLPRIDTSKTCLAKFCPASLKYWHCDNERYRTFDGVCNNWKNPDWGQAMTTYKRFLSPDYKDLIREPRASITSSALDLPSPRMVSLIVHKDQQRCALSANFLHVSFGQLLAHDLSKKQGFRTLKCCDGSEAGDAGHGMCLPIEINPSDAHYMENEVSCMSFTRSQFGVTKGCQLGTMQQLNIQTGTMDGSGIYGFSRELVYKFRENDGTGKLITIEIDPMKKRVLPGRDCTPMNPPGNTCVWDAGDGRVNENPGLAVMTLIFFRLHNFIAEKLKELHPTWEEDQLFHEARHITVAIFQHIAYNEFLPLLLGMKAVKKYGLLPGKGHTNSYDAKVNPQVSNSMCTAALRSNHGTCPGFIETRDKFWALLDRVDLSDLFFQPINEPVDDYIRGGAKQCAHTPGASMTSQLTGFLFKTDGHNFGNDLAAINIQRGRDHGIPNYNKWRKWCGLKPLKTWKDLYKVIDPKSAKMLEQMYLSLDDIDLWSAGVAENTLPGAMVGETFACLLGRSFKDLKIGDRFFYDNGGLPSSFSPAQLLQIKNVKLSTLYCTLTDDITSIQPWALALPHNGNGIMDCDVQAPLSFTAWKDCPAPILPPSLL